MTTRLLMPWIGLVLILALGGCETMRSVAPEESAPVVAPSTPQPSAPVIAPRAPQPVSDVENLLSYFQRLKSMQAPALAGEYENARQAYARTRSEFNRVRLAMILSLPGIPFGDEPQALALLDPVVRNQRAPLHGFAYLLAAQLQEHRKLSGTVQSLQNKLDALKSLERTMTEREAGSSNKR